MGGQIAMNADAGAPQVRFNEEVNAVLKVRFSKPLGKALMETGEKIVLDNSMKG